MTRLSPDHLGSTSVVTDGTGYLVQVLDYRPFGELAVSEQFASYESPYTFTGKERDEESGLIYFEARYYGDTWGRFTSQDPVVLAIGTPSLKEKTGQELFNFLSDPQSLNSYAYVRNNPLRLVDPDGEWFKEVITGKQSWNDFVVEIGDAGNYLYDDSKLAKTIMDHPYATGVVTGVAGGVAAEGGAAAIGAFSEAYLGGAGMGCVAWCGKVVEEGVEVGTKLLNGPINITADKLQHVLDRHTIDGLKTTGNSIFNAGESIISLIKQGTQIPTQLQTNGNFQRIFDVGRNIGIDRATGQQTSIMTVITNRVGDMITAFPGIPPSNLISK